MDPSTGPSAAEWLATVEADELADVLYHLGEERFARRIARAIVEARLEEPIETTGHLAAIVSSAVPRRERDRHPATRSFQAIRIHINGELEALDTALAALPGALAPRGRAAVISFHSLEDRRVKRFFRDAAGRRAPVARDAHGRVPPTEPEGAAPTLKTVGRAIAPSAAEAAANPRARSARLRVAERLP
jgi:16S rRNA (cytosine1402-N4)-methyltransferase